MHESLVFYDVHPSVAMVQKWLTELPTKAAQSLDEWIDIVKRHGPKDLARIENGSSPDTNWVPILSGGLPNGRRGRAMKKIRLKNIWPRPPDMLKNSTPRESSTCALYLSN